MKKRAPAPPLMTIAISDGSIALSLRLHEPQFLLLHDILRKAEDERYIAKEIGCSDEGLIITGEKEPYVYIYRPDFLWAEFLQEQPQTEFDMKGQQAVDLFKRYEQWAIDKSAAYALSDLESGKITFADLENLAPYLKDHPIIQRKAAHCLFSGNIPTRRGKPKSNEPPETQLLIQWVGYYRTDSKTTIETAVVKALQNHPELIPPHWEEPEDALAKAYKRSIQKPKRS